MLIRTKKIWVVIPAFVLPLFLPDFAAASARGAVQEGNRLYQQGQFADSLKKYEEALGKAPESEVLHFNAGAALYKQDRYEGAKEHFQKAILSEQAPLRQRAHYNLGNSFYKSGIAKEKTDIGAAIKSLEESLRHFTSALDIDKNDRDAQYNYEFVKKELERLRQEQRKQEQQQQSQQSKQGGEGQNQQAQSQEESREQREAANQSQKQAAQQPQEEQVAQQPQKPEEKPQESTTAEQRFAAGGESAEKEAAQNAATGQTGQELTPEEAKRLLQHYSQTEEPQGLLHVFEEKHETAPVVKDW